MDGWKDLRIRLEYSALLNKGFILWSKGIHLKTFAAMLHMANTFQQCFDRPTMVSTVQIDLYVPIKYVFMDKIGVECVYLFWNYD